MSKDKLNKERQKYEIVLLVFQSKPVPDTVISNHVKLTKFTYCIYRR